MSRPNIRAIASLAPYVLAGVTAMAIGIFLLIAPTHFHTSYGIDYAGNTSLLSEVRGMGAIIAGSGLTMLVALVHSSTRVGAQLMALSLFLSIVIGRALSLVLDGVPHPGLVVAGGVELLIGIACLVPLALRVPSTNFERL